MKKVSIITVCYNSAETIRHTIESVLSQDYRDVEYIVIDGLSSDSTITVINEYSEKVDKIVSEVDQGIYDAINKGIEICTGEIVGILNSDDFYENRTVISDVIAHFEAHKSASLIYGDVVFVDRANTGKILRFYSSKNFKSWKLRFGWMPPHPATFIKKSVYNEFGNYKINYKISADYELFVRFLMLHKVDCSRIDKVLVRMRTGGISTSGIKNIILLNLEIIRACSENKIYTNLFMLMFKIPFKILELFKKPN